MNARILLALSAIALACAACSSTQYIIGTKTGQLLESGGKPSLDEKTGIYTYEDAEGKKAAIAKDEVGRIVER